MKKITPAQAITVTPAQAQKWLDGCNHNNRNIRKTFVDYLVRQIKEQRWVLIGNPIAFDINGRLIDGQHRLKACILSEKSIEVFVIYGLGVDAYAETDTGNKRTLADTTDFSGKECGIIRAYLELAVEGKSIRKSAKETVKAYEDHTEEFDMVFAEHVRDKGIGQVAVWGALVFYATNSLTCASDFARAIKDPLTTQSQAQVLRNWLLVNTMGSGESVRRAIFGRAIYCMDAHYREDPIRRIRFTTCDNVFGNRKKRK